jgi:hypothetical protein
MLRAIASTPVCIMPGENYDMRLPGKGNEIQPFLYFIYSRRALSLPFHSCPVGLFQSLLGVFHIHFIPFLHDISILAGSVSHSFPALFLNPYRVRFHIHFIPSLHNISILAGFLLHSSPALFLNHYRVPCWVQFLFHLFSLSRPAPPLVPAQFFIPGAPTLLFRSVLSVPPMCYSTHTCMETTCTAGS